MKVLCNIMVMRSSSTRKPYTFPTGLCPCWLHTLCSRSHCLACLYLCLPGLLMSRGANFMKLLHCKSEISLSVDTKETANKHLSRKRLNGAPDMIAMALTQLQAIYRPSADPDAHFIKQMLIVATPWIMSFMSCKCWMMKTQQKMRVTLSECSSVAYRKGRKGREIFISRGEEKATCVWEMERERDQIDRQSRCDSKQSQITLACVCHGTSSCGSADTIVRTGPHLLGQGDSSPH